VHIAPFDLERYFANFEFSTPFLLSSSDCEAISMHELLEMADRDSKSLWQSLKLGYTESSGHQALREAIAAMYDGISADNIVVVVPQEGIFLLMHALLKPGDHVICTFPAYQSLYEVARSIGCQFSKWEADEQGGWRFDITALKNLLQSNTRLLVVNFPHNPTGFMPPKEDFEEIIDLVRKRGIHILSDEMYRFLEVDPDGTLPAACTMYERAHSLSGLSKSFGLPGLRIGWIATQNHTLLQQIRQLKDYTTICASAPSEILALIAIQNGKKIIEQQKKRIHRNLAVLDNFFVDYSDCFNYNRPAGGSICFPRLLIHEGAQSFCASLIDKAGIMLVPSGLFQFGDNHVRMGFGRENFSVVIMHFKNYLNEYYR
jgi:aspartate/methionine/tyrosine aminotransferase